MPKQWLTFPVFFPVWFYQGEGLNKVPISLQHIVLFVSSQVNLLAPLYQVECTHLQVSGDSLDVYKQIFILVSHVCWHLLWNSIQHLASWVWKTTQFIVGREEAKAHGCGGPKNVFLCSTLVHSSLLSWDHDMSTPGPS